MKLSAFLLDSAKVFAEYTAIGGVGAILRSSHWCESAFWSLVLVGCVGLTIRDCRPAVLGYMNEDTLTSTKFFTNTTMSITGASLCIEIDTSELWIRNVSRLGDDASIEEFSKCLQNESCFVSGGFLNEFIDEVYAAAKLIAWYGALENGRSNEKNASKESASAIPEAFYRRLVASSISSAELIEKIAYLICRSMNFEVTHIFKINTTSFDFCTNAELVWFSVPPSTQNETDVLCYAIDRFMTAKSIEEIYSISLNPYRFLPRQSEEIRSLYNKAYFTIDGVPIVTDLTSDYVTIPFEKCTHVDIHLQEQIRQLSTRFTPCDPESEPRVRCSGRCTIDELDLTCECSSVSWPMYIPEQRSRSSNTSCFDRYSPSEYEKCTAGLKSSTRRKACNARCLYPCAKSILRITELECMTEYLIPNRTQIAYRFAKLSYSHVEEQLQYDVSGLFSNLGGVIGLWLGVGVIGLLEVVLFVPKALLSYAFGKTPVKEDVSELHYDPVQERIVSIEKRLDAMNAQLVDLLAHV